MSKTYDIIEDIVNHRTARSVVDPSWGSTPPEGPFTSPVEELLEELSPLVNELAERKECVERAHAELNEAHQLAHSVTSSGPRVSMACSRPAASA